MDSDPALLLVNLFLLHYESEWRVKMENIHHHRARKFCYVYRFIDDLIDDNKEFIVTERKCK